MNLHNISLNKEVVIKSINIKDKVLKTRLLDLGFVKGEKVKKIYNAPLFDPAIIKIRNYEIAISNNILKGIEVI